MQTMPLRCKDIALVGAFCDRGADAGSADPAARVFCRRADSGGYTSAAGDDLAELKKALQDREEKGC